MVSAHDAFTAWRAESRRLLRAGIPPHAAPWDAWAGVGGLWSDPAPAAGADDAPSTPVASISPQALDLFRLVSAHRDPSRHARMYGALWRMTHGERGLLDDAADADVIALTRMAKAVSRARHKMTAFVRFRRVGTEAGERWIAVFEPEHDVLALTAPFFVRRFATMDWTLVTPDGCARWDRRRLALFAVADAPPAPSEDAAESLWLTYYTSIFNPARLNVATMEREMPRAYWKLLPEAAVIPALVVAARDARPPTLAPIAAAPAPGRGMQRAAAARHCAVAPADDSTRDDGTASDDLPFPDKSRLDGCRRCPLGGRATQGVPGEGPPNARVMLVGEQPGDEEDLAGRPFVGPAGKLLRRAIAEAGGDATTVYITNAVKHFSFELRGKRRIHKTPAQREIEACRLWLEAEIEQVRPVQIVALGATALAATLGRRVRVGEARGTALRHGSGAGVTATYHPSAVLRAPDEARKRELYAALVGDLRRALGAGGED
ncbi:MAG: UdgX family uracil-DNA binding protein [Proteobacteria bacterium]|nr:UdgX family uracil-DNA binding protein [Pseudomonadota bacterium]